VLMFTKKIFVAKYKEPSYGLNLLFCQIMYQNFLINLFIKYNQKTNNKLLKQGINY